MVSKNLEEWDLNLLRPKSAYNRAPTCATPHFPFKSCYRVNPLTPIGLLLLTIEYKVSFKAHMRAKEMNKLHEKIRAQIKKVNASYKARASNHRNPTILNPGDLICLHFLWFSI